MIRIETNKTINVGFYLTYFFKIPNNIIVVKEKRNRPIKVFCSDAISCITRDCSSIAAKICVYETCCCDPCRCCPVWTKKRIFNRYIEILRDNSYGYDLHSLTFQAAATVGIQFRLACNIMFNIVSCYHMYLSTQDDQYGRRDGSIDAYMVC